MIKISIIMVYQKIKVIYGLLVTKEELYQLIEALEGEKLNLEKDYDLRDLVDIPIHRFPACSCTESENRECFVLGDLIDTIWRRKSNCTLCEIHSVCDRCIGMTESGFYPVQTIYEKLVECPIENVCSHCLRANSGKLTVQRQSKQIEYIKHRCGRCNYKSNTSLLPNFSKFDLSDKSEIIEELEKLRKTQEITEKAYFMLDDCLSCT